MCIQTLIEQAIAQKEVLDARIAKLEQIQLKTAPVKTLLSELLADYSDVAPEDLAAVWQEILAIGGRFYLSVQPLAADELQQWEAVNAENEILKQQLKEARSEITERNGKCGFLKYERDDLKKEVSELRSQIEQLKDESDKWRAAATISNLAVKSLTEKQENSETPTTWKKEDVAPGLEKLWQEAVTENTEPVSDSIPAFTLWQPWATLIEQEIKRIETRSWSTSYRGPIAIHAAKKPIYTGSPELLDLLQKGIEPPLGAVIAIANLVDCVEMTPEFIAQQSEQELKCGDWQPGRFAWVLEIIRPVVPPIPATGGQKLWNWSGTSIKAELEYLENKRELLALEFSEPESEMVLTGDEYDAAVEEELGCNWEDEDIEQTNQPSRQSVEPIAEEGKPDTERYRNFNQVFELQDFKVDVRQHNNGNEFAGASFNFYQEDKLIHSQSLTAVECVDKRPKELATEIIETYWQKLREKHEREAYAKEEDKFVELVKISNCVGYLKRRDSGEILAGYVAFSMRDEDGEKLTFAKPRAQKWAEYLRANNEASEEGKISNLSCSDPRKSKRLVSDNPNQVFAYELKFTGIDMGYLERLAQQDFSIPPGEQKVKKSAAAKTELAPIYQVIANGYQIASGTEQEMRSRFEQELQTFGSEGRSAMSLTCNGENIEAYYYNDFAFIRAQDFDEENPEYFTVYKPTKTNFRVYRSLASGADWVNSVYPYNALSTKEAAAVDAIRRQLKTEKAE